MALQMEFCLLGPLVVRKDGRAVPLPAAKPRVTLAALLLNPGRVVALDELAEVVWGTEPPASARVTLQNYVKRLRITLGDTDHSRILTRPPGYQINLDGAELDVTRFEMLQREARRAAGQGEWREAVARLRSALALWRGEPLADVPSELLLCHRASLLEMRAQALEARIDADLHLGRHSAVICELRRLTAADPLRERPYGLLMLALYRDGQQGAALAAYQSARQSLITELGVEPGPDLRRLHHQILTGDPALAAISQPADQNTTVPAVVSHATPSRPAAGPDLVTHDPGQDHWPFPLGPVVPRQLPAAPRHFAGRQDELKVLSQLLDESADDEVGTVVISAIGGTAGVGKTALAVHWAHQAADRFPDGQLYVNLRGFDPAGPPMRPAEAIRGFLDALQVQPEQIPADLDAQAGLYRSLLAGKRMLVVLDNARDTGHVRPLLPGSGGCLVVVTSRSQLGGLIAEGAHALVLDVLALHEARELLARRLGRERVAAEPSAVGELTNLCARLPLALAITAARGAAHPSFPLAGLAAELRNARSRLDALSAGEEAADVRAVFSWSCQQLSASAARVFRLLGLHPGPEATAAATASLADISRHEARNALAELAAAGLLAETAPGRYGFHDLLGAYAAEQATALESTGERHAAIHRVADHYLHTARAADQLLYPARRPIPVPPPQAGTQPEHFTSHEEALAWFDAEHRVLVAAVSLAAGHGLDACAWQLPWTMETFLYRRGHTHDWAATQRVALAAARRLGDLEGQAYANRGIGWASLELGAYDDAEQHLAEALRLYTETGDQAGRARIHLDLASANERQGRNAKAIRHDRLALEMFRAAGDRAGAADALSGLGWDLGQIGDCEGAVACCEEAIELLQQVGNNHGIGSTWGSLGFAHSQLGHHAEAAACYQRAIEILERLGTVYPKAEILVYAGDAYHAAGDPDSARDAWRQALTIFDKLRHPDAEKVRAKLHPHAAKGPGGRA